LHGVQNRQNLKRFSWADSILPSKPLLFCTHSNQPPFPHHLPSLHSTIFPIKPSLPKESSSFWSENGQKTQFSGVFWHFHVENGQN